MLKAITPQTLMQLKTPLLIDLAINASTQLRHHQGLNGNVKFIMVTFSLYTHPHSSTVAKGHSKKAQNDALIWSYIFQNKKRKVLVKKTF